VKYMSMAHPRANGQVKRANDMILDAMWSGDCEPSLVAIRAPPHTSWSMAQKQYSL
jgi:hypothetical protein